MTSKTTNTTAPWPDRADPAPSNRRAMWVSLALLVVAFAPTIIDTVRAWWDNPDYSHGLLMPFVAWWLLHQDKERVRGLKEAPNVAALPLLMLCILVMLAGRLDFVQSLAPYAFVGALGAVALGFFGWKGVRVFLPALIVLGLACPLPGAVHDKLTLPLKEVSSQFSVGLLHITGVPAFLEGSMIHLEEADSLWVADACSGIRSFISLLSIAIVACLVWRRPWPFKILIVLAAIPIAVIANGLRIWLTGYLSVHVGSEAAEGAFHFFEGFALFGLACLLLAGLAGLLSFAVPRQTA